MNAPLLWGVAAYVAAQLAIGFVVSRRIRTEDDYMVAGRSLGPVLLTVTVFATWFGAETCIGAAGALYERGLAGGSADPFGYGLCIVLAGLVLAVPLWRLRLTTLADLFRLRYSRGVEQAAVVLMVPASLFWAAAQIRAFGQVVAAASGVSIGAALALAAGVVVVYTAVGGLLADAWTDLVQGLALVAGLVALFVTVLAREGWRVLEAVPPAALDPTAGHPSLLALLEEWTVPVVGSLVAAEVVARMVGSRSAAVARNGTVVAGVAYLVIGLMPVALGLAGMSLVPGLEDPERILPVLAERYLPGALYVLFAGALLSAILSTADSALLVAASMVAHNVVAPLRPDLSQRARVRIARAWVVVFGAAAFVVAWRAERVYDLVEEASAFGSAGIVTVVLFGLFTRVGGAAAAHAALVGGVVAWVLGAYVLGLPYPYLTSLAVAVGAYVVGAGFGTAGEAWEAVLDEAAAAAPALSRTSA